MRSTECRRSIYQETPSRDGQKESHPCFAEGARSADSYARSRRSLRACEPHRAEHLELSVENPMPGLPKLGNAGAIFLGRWSSEGESATIAPGESLLRPPGPRASPRRSVVYDFQKRSSIIEVSKNSADRLGTPSPRRWPKAKA